MRHLRSRHAVGMHLGNSLRVVGFNVRPVQSLTRPMYTPYASSLTLRKVPSGTVAAFCKSPMTFAAANPCLLRSKLGFCGDAEKFRTTRIVPSLLFRRYDITFASNSFNGAYVPSSIAGSVFRR